MSSATLVVRQYETAAELSERFGCALIDLIKIHRSLPGYEGITTEQQHASQRLLADVVVAVERALGAEWVDTHAHHNGAVLPEGFAPWLQATHQGDAVTPHDLARVRTRLGDVPARCDDADVALLERLSRVIDAHTSHLFRRLTHEAGSR